MHGQQHTNGSPPPDERLAPCPHRLAEYACPPCRSEARPEPAAFPARIWRSVRRSSSQRRPATAVLRSAKPVFLRNSSPPLRLVSRSPWRCIGEPHPHP